MSPTEQVKQKRGFITYLNDLFPFDWELLKYAGAEPVPHHLQHWWFALGGTPVILFIIQLITGIALTFYYVPSPDHAYASVDMITHEIRFGWFIRSLHSWSSNLLIVAVFLHMLRVYFTGAYRHPRQLNWLFGSALLGTMLLFGFTGYSLIYEQMSFWGATVSSNLIEAVPFVGPLLKHLIIGGPEVGDNTLTRFFILHIGVLPTAVAILLGLHIMLVRLHGVKELHFEDQVVPDEKRFFKFWPDHAMTELLVGLVLMYLLVILALIFPAHLGEPANPTLTPPHIKPEWYFFASFRLLQLMSLKASVVLTMILATVILFWPFIEEQLVKRFRLSEKVPIFLGIIVFGVFLALTVWEALA